MDLAQINRIAKAIPATALIVLAILMVGCGRSNTKSAHPAAVATKAIRDLQKDDAQQLSEFWAKKDYPHSLPLALKLARQRNSFAQYMVGLMYMNGSGVEKDYPEALHWFRLAAANGSREARRSIGFMYDSGWGVPQDYAAAYGWYNRAARQGDPPAQMLLGGMYLYGHGVPQDKLIAHMWLSLAASSTDSVNSIATKYRDNLSETLSSADLLEAQKMARLCEQSKYKMCDRTDGQAPSSSDAASISMKNDGGVYMVPVRLNDAITLDFIVDSGASSVSIPADVVLTLMRAGTIDESDFIGDETYTLADGSTTPSAAFRIRSLQVGNITLRDVKASVSDVRGPLLLGQSFLNKFGSWSIDNDSHSLILGGASNRDRAAPSTTKAADDVENELPGIGGVTSAAVDPTRDNARARTLNYFAEWSAPDNSGLAKLAQFYGSTINYYGSIVPQARVLQEKYKFANRWPSRRYVVRLPTLTVACTTQSNCVVDGLLDWDAQSDPRNAHSSGVAKFHFEFSDGLISAESGQVVSRSTAPVH